MKAKHFALAATALLIVLAVCTQDELADDNRLPEGEYPVVIRATVDGAVNWQSGVANSTEHCPP